MKMRPTLKTRKPIDQLTVDDFTAFPIWEFAIDEEDVEGRDETWVRPVDARTVRKGLWSLSVAALFRTRSGMSIPGFVGVTTANGIELEGGVLLSDHHYIVIDVSNASARSATARALGLSVQLTFPLTFVLRALIGREKAF
jgi:hypothetical protein